MTGEEDKGFERGWNFTLEILEDYDKHAYLKVEESDKKNTIRENIFNNENSI